MKTLAKLALTTTLIGATAFTGMYGTAFAQSNSNSNEGTKVAERGDKRDYRRHGPRRGVGFFHVMCREVGDERINRFFERAGERLEITSDQQAAFDGLKQAVTDAQKSFSAKCQATRQDKPENMVERLQTRQTMMEARLEANKQILPAFEAFYDVLTDEQKEKIEKMRGKGRKGGKGERGRDKDRRG